MLQSHETFSASGVTRRHVVIVVTPFALAASGLNLVQSSGKDHSPVAPIAATLSTITGIAISPSARHRPIWCLSMVGRQRFRRARSFALVRSSRILASRAFVGGSLCGKRCIWSGNSSRLEKAAGCARDD